MDINQEKRTGCRVEGQDLAGEDPATPCPATQVFSATDILRIIEGYTYKPGYKLSAWSDGGTVTVNMYIPVPDSTTPEHKMVDITYTHRISVCSFMFRDKGAVHYFMNEFFRGWELHEMNEWVRYEGKLLNDPHAPVKI